LVNRPYDITHAEQRARYNAYRWYVESSRKLLPALALEFALADWHYDPSDHRCPHDAWVECLSIIEPATGERHERRSLDIRLELISAHHDGRIRITYPGVRRYSLFQPGEHTPVPAEARGHGDWLVDEVSPSDNSRPEQPLVIHEIIFSRHGVWTIESEDIRYEWLARRESGEVVEQ